jgi:hypothetical protein
VILAIIDGHETRRQVPWLNDALIWTPTRSAVPPCTALRESEILIFDAGQGQHGDAEGFRGAELLAPTAGPWRRRCCCRRGRSKKTAHHLNDLHFAIFGRPQSPACPIVS